MPDTAEPFPVARGANTVSMLPGMANRHGLIAGATGTGKTTTLRVLAENFSAIGVPVFLADVKGDLSGMAKAGGDNKKALQRAQELGLSGIAPEGFPVTFWDAYGEAGHPVRTTISEMGPLLLARILDLNDIQTDVLTVLFKIADDEGLLLLDLKDLMAMARYLRGPCKGVEDPVREHLPGKHRVHPAEPPGPGTAGRGSSLRRTGTECHGFCPHRQRRTRDDQYPCGRSADAVPPGLYHLPPLAPL